MIIGVLGAFLAALPVAHDRQQDLVQRLIERTRTTRAAYALISTNELRRDGRVVHEFSAEYNQGDFHRVETPRDRIVGNCRTGWTAHLEIASGRISHGDGISASICGVDPNLVLRSAEITGSRQSKFGPVQHLKIETYGPSRTYEIASNGAIVAETITDLNGVTRLRMKAISLSAELPALDLFSEASLATSVIPDDLKRRASDGSEWQRDEATRP